jgi:hypothetical protein
VAPETVCLGNLSAFPGSFLVLRPMTEAHVLIQELCDALHIVSGL